MKQLIGGLILLLTMNNVYACDICGGASNSFTVGLLSNNKNHFVGIRSGIRWFESAPTPDDHGYLGVSHQQFTTTELFGRWRVSKRFQVLGFVPYVYNSKMEDVRTNISGLGDVILMGNYIYLDNTEKKDVTFKHIGTVGLGVKIPTGTYFQLGFDEVNMLPGTGSWDGILNLSYMIQKDNFGLQNESSFTYKTENKYTYRFGNAFSYMGLFFYRWKLKEKVQIIPQLGVSVAHNWKDRKNGELSEDTFNGGNIVGAQVNLRMIIKQIGVNIEGNVPVSQSLNKGYVDQKGMIRVGVNYYIKTSK
ncbi:MAG: hypothetical protein HWE22_04025 [Flavobacteriales bacterium]|nr:hypothetical protein [Flavobacteriales bacterium]